MIPRRNRTAGLAALVGVLLYAAIPSRAGAVGFSAPVNFQTSAGPREVAIGDYNGDTIPDLAVAALSVSRNVSVLLGTGGGAFAPRTDYAITNEPSAIVTADFDHDDDLDLAVAGGGSIQILLGAGDGSFSAPTTITSSLLMTGMVVGDFNEDTHPDLAVSAATGAGIVGIFLGNGAGGFAPATTFPVGTDPISNPQEVATGDFNGDTHLDLAFANSGAATGKSASIILGNGAGGFGPPAAFPLGNSPRSVAVGDFDGDLDLDLVIGDFISSTSSTVVVLLGNGAGGMGAPTTFPAGIGVPSITVADLDEDDILDLAIANGGTNSVSVLLGNGSGGFGSPANFPTANLARPRQVAVGDLSGDGRPDLAVAATNGPTVSVLFNLAAPTITGQATPTAAIGQAISDQATLANGDNATGTITFRAYGPNDTGCSASPAFVSAPVTVAGNGTYNSPPFTPSVAGTYRWIPSYSGDARNQPASGSCNDPGQTSVVETAVPAFTATATPTATLGQPIVDEATLAGGFNPTGAITFTAYGPDDESCSGPPAFVSPPAAVAGNGTYASSPFIPEVTGSYRWIASYSGDANNEAASRGCTDPAQLSVVQHLQSLPTSKDALTCQNGTAKSLATLVKLKVNCATKCLRTARRTGGPFAECLPPYGGSTAVCITGVLRGAEAKARAKIAKACTKECPNCYDAEGSCPDGAGLVAKQEAEVDAIAPLVFCVEGGGGAPTKAEQRCEDDTAKSLVKFFASKSKCFQRCIASAFDGRIAASSCQAGAVTDPATAACIAKAGGKAISKIDRACAPPRGTMPACHTHPDGASWVARAEAAVERHLPATYCGSPGGAFLD